MADEASKLIKFLDQLIPFLETSPTWFKIWIYAMVMARLNRQSEFDRALTEADRMFEAILAQDRNDSGAWNGLGSVALLSNNPQKGLYFINRALELTPDYPQALQDKQTAIQMLREQEKK
jgi:tetratricopeptide (TPR) repeat protein